MKIMKFGGTSVGKPERMAEIRKLVTKDDEPKIIVLSALSGTTNALTEISDALSKGNRDEAKKRIDALENHYQNFIVELLKSEAYFKKAKDTLADHFEFLNIILKISYSEALNKDILGTRRIIKHEAFQHLFGGTGNFSRMASCA